MVLAWSSIIYRMDDPQKGGMAFFFFLQPQLTPTDCHYVRMGPEMSFSNKRLEFQLFRTVNLTLKPKPSGVYCRPLATDCSGLMLLAMLPPPFL